MTKGVHTNCFFELFIYLYTLAISPSLGGSRQHKRTTKTMGTPLRSSSNDERPSRVWMALLEQHSPSSPVFHNLRRFTDAISPTAPTISVPFSTCSLVLSSLEYLGLWTRVTGCRSSHRTGRQDEQRPLCFSRLSSLNIFCRQFVSAKAFGYRNLTEFVYTGLSFNTFVSDVLYNLRNLDPYNHPFNLSLHFFFLSLSL